MNDASNAPKPVILVVDDTTTNLQILHASLSSAGYRVLIAENGQTALTRLEFAQPDLILLDVMMPDIDGFEICRRIKKRPQTTKTPVIFMTARDDTQSKVLAFDAGAVDYITKPMDEKELLLRIRTHLEISRLRAELEVQIDHKEAVIQDLDAFSHTVAHDLKNPLNAILGSAEILETMDDLPPEEVREFATGIREASETMGAIIEDLLLLARAERQKVKVGAIDTRRILESSLRRLHPQIKASGAEVVVEGTFPPALAYGPWIEAVCVNLLSNAIKYGGRPPLLHCGASSDDSGRVRVWVRDNGQGMSTEQLDRLFRPFERMSDVQVEGTGLGLTIVKKIVGRFEGEVDVESAPGEGSIFSFTLPGAEMAQASGA